VNQDKLKQVKECIIKMETRVCRKCGRELQIEKFELDHTKNGDIRRRTCRECRQKQRKEWRKRNPEKYHAQAIRRQNNQTQWLYSLKKPCIICGESEPVCIDFHHINSDDKEYTIGRNRGKSKEHLLEEISKCVCLCSNCHRKVHAGIIKLDNYLNNCS